MAIFNPQVAPAQDTAPSYLGYSKGIEGGFGVDKSGGIGLETAANAITSGVEIVDTGIKDYLKDDIRKTVEKQRDDYTSYLETLKGIAQTNKIPGADTTADGSDSLIGNDGSADIPDGLQAGLDRAKNLAAAGNTGNRINDTLYTANLASAASELRTRFSGYKDYIDKKFSEYSGMDSANAYYKNLMQDINTLAAKGNAASKSVDAIILGAVREGEQGMDDGGKVYNADKIWSLRQLNKNDPTKGLSEEDALHLIYNSKSLKSSATAAEAARTARKGDRDDTAAVATRDFSNEMAGKVQADTLLLQVGTGNKSLKDTIAWLNTQANNPNGTDPKQVQAVVTALDAQINNIYNDGMARASQRDSTGQTYITRMGGAGKVKDEIEANLAGLRQYRDSVNNGQFGIGTYVQRAMLAQSQADQRDLLNDPNMRKSKAIQDAFPTFGDIFVKTGLAGNVPEYLNNYMNSKRIDAITQPDFLSSGKPSTMKKDFDEFDTKIGQNPKYTSTDLAKLKNEAFNIPKTIADPRAPIDAKANIARHAFDPENIGILQGIKMDYTDPTTGKYIPGKYSAFTRMTSPDITDGMEKVRNGVQDGPQLWANYKNWTNTEFQKLFREDAANLNGLADTRMHIGWVSGDGQQPPRMQLLNDKGQEITGAPPTYSIGQAMRTVQRINSGMYNLHQVYRKDGEDTNMPILQAITQTWTPSEKTTGLPAKIMEAIIQSNKDKVRRIEDTFHKGE